MDSGKNFTRQSFEGAIGDINASLLGMILHGENFDGSAFARRRRARG